MISPPSASARASEALVLPTAVGPVRMSTLGRAPCGGGGAVAALAAAEAGCMDAMLPLLLLRCCRRRDARIRSAIRRWLGSTQASMGACRYGRRWRDDARLDNQRSRWYLVRVTVRGQKENVRWTSGDHRHLPTSAPATPIVRSWIVSRKGSLGTPLPEAAL